MQIKLGKKVKKSKKIYIYNKNFRDDKNIKWASVPLKNHDVIIELIP